MSSSATNHSSLLEQVDHLKGNLTAFATGGQFDGDNDGYLALRQSLRAHPDLYQRLPDFVRDCRDLGEFWEFIKKRYGTYRERRAFLRQSFAPLVQYLEEHESDLPMVAVTETLTDLNSDTVDEVWTKALYRSRHDPEGAITAARTMLETVCKHILDDRTVPYSTRDDLPRLWNSAATELNLSPSQHEAIDIKALLGNCQAVVNGIANLRNAIGDAHGQGRQPMRARPKHAALAVNLAGTMATFMVATWAEQSQSDDEQ